MTVFTYLVPDRSSWTSFWNWGYPQGRGCGEASHIRFQDPSHIRFQDPSCKEIQIPIQIGSLDTHRRHECQEPVYPDIDYDMSDSDDCFEIDDNVNNNSSRTRRKKRHVAGSASKPMLIPSSDSLLNEVIEIDPKPKSTKIGSRSVKSKDESWQPPADKSTSKTQNGSPIKTRSGGLVNCVSGYVADSDNSGNSDFEDEINRPSSYSVYDYLQPMLKKTGRHIDAIKGDGNCFFRALSKVIYGKQNKYMCVRKAVVQVLQKHAKKFEAFTDGPISEHIEEIKLNKTWATQTEIYAAATLLQRDIYILTPNQTGGTYHWLLFSPQLKYVTFEYDEEQLCPYGCYVTLCHTHGNHYDRVATQKGLCNCDLPPPALSGVKGSVDLTNVDEIV